MTMLYPLHQGTLPTWSQSGETDEGKERYDVYDVIASGGTATVHLGLERVKDRARPVAIKRLHRHLRGDPESVASFYDEARLARYIASPFVVVPFDVVNREDDLLAIMEYVHGVSLARLLRESRTLRERVPPSVGCAVVLGLLRGLHALHEAVDDRGRSLQMVHRDVSPHNVVVGRDGFARVIDLGICASRGRRDFTPPKRIVGKVSYMAPEQLCGDDVSRAADIYAAGVVLWEILAGTRLFKDCTERELCGRVLGASIEPPSAFAPVPTELDAIVRKALAANPRDRYGTANAMALALKSAARVAEPDDVTAWVTRLFGEPLEERSRRVAQIADHAGSCTIDPCRSRIESITLPTDGDHNRAQRD